MYGNQEFCDLIWFDDIFILRRASGSGSHVLAKTVGVQGPLFLYMI